MTIQYGKNILPSTVGFDRLLSTMEEFDRMLGSGGKTQTYPPYNILKYNTVEEENQKYEIQIAVAGFSIDDIDVEVKENKLTIIGSTPKSETVCDYLYHGLATRDFKHTFTLNDTVVVQSANIENGVLKIQLESIIPEEKKPRKIQIGFVDKPLLTNKK